MHAEPERPIPKPILIGGGLVMLTSLLLVASARSGLAPRQALPSAPIQAAFDFRVAPEAGGAEEVLRARDGERVAVLQAKRDDFLPTLIDKLQQERQLKGLPAAPPLRLVRWADGRVSLQDPSTGRELALDSFGAGNAADAGRLIDEGRAS